MSSLILNMELEEALFDPLNIEIKTELLDIEETKVEFVDCSTEKSFITENVVLNAPDDFHVVTEEQLFKCKISEHTINTDLKAHEKTFSGVQEFTSHILAHTVEELYECTLCEYATNRSNYLKIHMKVHDVRAKLFTCDACDYESTQLHNLKQHMRAHSDRKPYKCETCGYATAYSDNLKVHVRKHTGEKPYKCDSCRYVTGRPSDLKVHRKTCKKI